jgi:hypothetical protein
MQQRNNSNSLRLRNRYNPEYFHSKAVEILEAMSPEEARSWYDHPCTESLRMSLEGDLSGIVVTWLGGGYTGDTSSSQTAQEQAKARGMAQSIDNLLEHLQSIRDLSLEGEEDYGNAAHLP